MSGSVALVAALGSVTLALISCGSTTDCNDRRDCPRDLSAGTSGATGTSGASGHSGSGNGGASGTGGRVGTSGSAGTSGDAGSAGAAITCDSTLSPDADGCVISDTYGVFVAPTGNDTTGNGTEAAPYATLTAALAKLDQIKRIYVCAAEYVEPSTLEIPSGVAIYGGFGCDGGTWTYDSANNKASFKPQSPIGAEIKNASGVALTDLSITAADATSPGGSSFGVMVVSSEGVVLTRVAITAGKGGAGTSGAKGDDGAPGIASGTDQNGKPGSCAQTLPATIDAGTPAPAICQSQGGRGGTGYPGANSDMKGVDGSPNVSANGGLGGAKPGAAGIQGTFGLDGEGGTLPLAAAPMGSFSGTGYAVANGPSGVAAKPGQGGGGGGASFGATGCIGSGGGAGGMGGCGGLQGGGGMGGGASVALLTWSSEASLDSCTLAASAGGGGGKGGPGGLGGVGKAGGIGGAIDPANSDVKNGGDGGKGGSGGDGSSGSGGTGGPAIALVFDGAEPSRKNTKFVVPATGGAAGQGGRQGMNQARWAPDGSVGLAQDIYPKPK